MTDLSQTKPRRSFWTDQAYHRDYLWRQANNLFDFFQSASINPKGGFFGLDDAGKPLHPDNPPREIHRTCRIVHCFAIGGLIGRPGSEDVVDHGMRYLWDHHRDDTHGGYIWSLDDKGPKDDSKQAYAHAFVLLAASSAKLVGHPLADQMLADVTEVIETRFWDDSAGAMREEFTNSWGPIGAYRGQNSNMHSTEAFMAAFEATGETEYLRKAERIAEKIIAKTAVPLGHRVAEHFDGNWNVDQAYHGEGLLRPSGTMPGHSLEWSRLLYQLWILGGRRHDWMTEAAQNLFRESTAQGWDHKNGGFYYSLDWDNKPMVRGKCWWPVAEGIAAAAYIGALEPDEDYFQTWYRKIWGFAQNHVIDHAHGGWFGQLSEDLKPGSDLVAGKPDIYHALQACLIPLYPATGSVTKAILDTE